jgi:hypothetical protein
MLASFGGEPTEGCADDAAVVRDVQPCGLVLQELAQIGEGCRCPEFVDRLVSELLNDGVTLVRAAIVAVTASRHLSAAVLVTFVRSSKFVGSFFVPRLRVRLHRSVTRLPRSRHQSAYHPI